MVTLTSKKLDLEKDNIKTTIPLAGAKVKTSKSKSWLKNKSYYHIRLETPGNVIEIIFNTPKEDYSVFKWESSIQEVVEELIPRVRKTIFKKAQGKIHPRRTSITFTVLCHLHL